MNPFRFGSVVSGEFFFNRHKEKEEIKQNLKSGQNLTIYAPRRYGKTSLINLVLNELEQEGYITIFIDCYKINSIQRFIELYSKKIIEKKKGNIKDILSWFSGIIKNITPVVTLDNEGQPSFSINYQASSDKEKDLSNILDLAQKISSTKKTIVVFDEFQEIKALNGESFEKFLRSNIQFHDRVNYIFMGSKTHMILDMFQNINKPFYKSGKLFPLDKIPENEVRDFLHRKFQSGSRIISENILDYIIKTSENIPHYIQYLASEIWNNSIDGATINMDIADLATEKILQSQSDYYLELYSSLSLYQKQVVRALCISGELIYSLEYTLKHKLSSVSSTQRVIEKLISSGIIEKNNNKYEFSDPFFKKFLIKNEF